MHVVNAQEKDITLYKYNSGLGAIICNKCRKTIISPCDPISANNLGKYEHYCKKHIKYWLYKIANFLQNRENN